MTQPRFSDLSVGDRIYRTPETVVAVEALFRDVPYDYMLGTTTQPTGRMLLTVATEDGEQETVEVAEDDLVHASTLFSGCDS